MYTIHSGTVCDWNIDRYNNRQRSTIGTRKITKVDRSIERREGYDTFDDIPKNLEIFSVRGVNKCDVVFSTAASYTHKYMRVLYSV